MDTKLHLHICRTLGSTPGDEPSGGCGGDMGDSGSTVFVPRRCGHKRLAGAVDLCCREVCAQATSGWLDLRRRAVASFEGAATEVETNGWEDPAKVCASSENELGAVGADECIVA